MYYLVNEKRYYDNYMIRQRFQLSKSVLQCLMKRYEFKNDEVVKVDFYSI